MSKSCPKCGGRMVEGFTPDAKEHGASLNVWIEGAPQKSFWGYYKTKGRGKFDIQTWRCGRCAYLESYAPQV